MTFKWIPIVLWQSWEEKSCYWLFNTSRQGQPHPEQLPQLCLALKKGPKFFFKLKNSLKSMLYTRSVVHFVSTDTGVSSGTLFKPDTARMDLGVNNGVNKDTMYSHDSL